LLRDELQKVLEIEREGEKRLSRARADASRIVEGCRRQAEDQLRETREEIARTRESRISDSDVETSRLASETRRKVHERESFLHALAERNRGKAVDRIIALMEE
jgi:F0F1-type ATP synthase membrane subunit b/b'